MVSLDDLLEAEINRPPCRVGEWYDQLPETIKAQFDRLLEIGTATAPLHRACTHLEPPVPVGYQMFRKHLAGGCQCRRS